jgi:hypothetical protein
MTRYTVLLQVGERQAWLARRFKQADTGWTRTWTLALWVPLRAVYCFGFRLLVPRKGQ